MDGSTNDTMLMNVSRIHTMQQMAEFCNAVKVEVDIARELNEPFHSLHEGYAILLEEVTELRTEVFSKPSMRSKSNIINECRQIAAIAFCIVNECIGDVLPQEIRIKE